MNSLLSNQFFLGQRFPQAGVLPAQTQSVSGYSVQPLQSGVIGLTLLAAVILSLSNCGDPPRPRRYTLVSFTGRYLGSTAEYICFTDFIKIVTIRCTSRGWESLPPCLISCGNPPAITGLKLLDFTTGTKDGDTRYYTCANSDQTFSPASPASSACSSVTCQKNGAWTALSVTCNTPPMTTNTGGSLSGTTGSITSPNHPGSYSPPNMAMYRYSIVTPGDSITLTFNGAFGIDSASFLNIYCGFHLATASPTVSYTATSVSPGQFTCPTGCATVVFDVIPGGAGSQAGFNITWMANLLGK
ncbi:hypothetical protein ACJMK2_021696 [Sinanodonta woodiana]|uniref:Sushi domain-containing protein n=1 Tax=Sinanodonta woodiana TaxID=1069815 RepID=A0ABD3TIS9_SINWO